MQSATLDYNTNIILQTYLISLCDKKSKWILYLIFTALHTKILFSLNGNLKNAHLSYKKQRANWGVESKEDK